MSVKDNLQRLLEIHSSRNALYKNDYDRIGHSMVAMFPQGVALNTHSDFARFAILTYMNGKLMRYAQQFSEGGHADSLDDNAVYSMILRHLDDSNDLRHGNDGPNREPHAEARAPARDNRVRKHKR